MVFYFNFHNIFNFYFTATHPFHLSFIEDLKSDEGIIKHDQYFNLKLSMGYLEQAKKSTQN